MGVLRKAAAVAALTGLALTGLFGSTTAASAATSGTAVYSATVTIPAPPASNFEASAGGDGWAVALTPTAVYNVFHHQGILTVACHLQSDASNCWSAPKTITDAGGGNFATSGQPGLYIDQASGHLFVFATRTADATAGVVCIDTTQPASNPDPFCGFTALSAVGAAPLQDNISGTSDPLLVNGEWFAFNYVGNSSVASNTANSLLCFNVTSFAACASQPYAVDLGGGTVSNGGFPSPSIADIAGQIIVPATTSSQPNGVLGCISAATLQSCGGSWPVPLTNNYPSAAGTAFPLLDSAGHTTGLCLPIGTDPCFDLSGASVATPANLASVVQASDGWNGPALVLGPRVYVANGQYGESNDSAVECFDFSTGKSCANFPKEFADSSVLNYLYTVNPDPERPSCIWVNADGGETGQIQNFDAYTGGPCGQGSLRLISAAIVVPQVKCQPANFTSLQLLTPAPGQYSSASVQFQDNDADPIPGLAPQPLDNTGSVNLAPFDLTTKAELPQFVITLTNPPPTLSQAVVKLMWTGVNDPSCAGPGVTITGQAPGQSAPGLMMLGGDGGFFSYGGLSFVGTANFGGVPGPYTTPAGTVIPTTFSGLAAGPGHTGYWAVLRNGQVFTVGNATGYGDTRNVHLSAPVVGMAATPSGKGYWLVASDGGVFSFGDAPFLGSLGAVHLASPIVAIMATPTGKGYWLVGADGGVFTFGDAPFLGSLGNVRLAAPVTSAVATGDGRGYLLAGADGGVFSFGTAPFHGSVAGIRLDGPVVAICLTPSGRGYWEVGSDGGLFTFGDAPYMPTAHFGSVGSLPSLAPTLRAPVVAATS